MPTQMFPVCPRADTNLMFLILFRNILCPQQMFPSLRSPRNTTGNKCPQQCVLVYQGLNVQKPTSGLVWYTKQGCRDVMQAFCSSHELHVPRGNFFNFAHKWHASIFLSQRDDRRGQNTNQVMLCENALFSQITLYLDRKSVV